MRKSCFFFCVLLISISSFSQQAVIDSLKNELSKATTNEKKVEALSMLSRLFMNVNLEQADKYGLQMTELAEASRDRKLMIKAMLANGERYSYLSARQENIVKATGFYNAALDLAKKNKLDEQVITALLALSEISRSVPDADKALNYCNQAFGYTGTVKNDSLLARVHLEYGSVYLFKNEKILALKNLMAAIRLAEDLKNPQLLRAGYTKLSGFYSNIEDYDKAIDYQVKAVEKLDEIKNGQVQYAKLQDLIKIGDLYTAKKSYDIAMTYYERAIAKADTLKFAPLKGVACRSIASCYMSSNQPKKALAYFNEHPEYADFLKTMNLSYFTDQFYGYIYAELGKYDSAKYYYDRIKNFMDTEGNSSAQISYYYGLGLLHKKTGENNKAIDYFLKTKALTEKIGELESQRMVVAELDTLYQRTGNYKLAMDYAALNRKFKDSADKLGKEKDLLQIEVADEQQRQERIEKEKAEQKENGTIYNTCLLLLVLPACLF